MSRVAEAVTLFGRTRFRRFRSSRTAALDGRTGREIVELLQRLAREQGCGVLMVTHDPRILDLADRLLAMEDGRLIENRVASMPAG